MVLVAIRFISIGKNSKKGLKEDRSEKEKEGKAFHLKGNNILIVLGAGKNNPNTKDSRKQKLI